MGNNLNLIKENIANRANSPLFEISLSKLIEYHGAFKSICENFSIDYTEFNEIFNEPETIFNLWDNDDNGLIDALELFSGLCLFSNSLFEDKIRFIFDLFDFNELNSLSLLDIEFMVTCCVTSSFRICGLLIDINQEEIYQFIHDSLHQQSRINISQLITFGANSKEINEFLTIIKRNLPHKEKLNVNQFMLQIEDPDWQIPDKLKEENYKVKTKQEKVFDNINIGQLLNNKKYQSRLGFYHYFMRKLNYNNDNKIRIKSSNIKLNWVYGFRCVDIARSFVFHSALHGDLEHTLIYFVANVVIIYYYKFNYQKHYLEHNNRVSCISIAKKRRWVATGEKGRQPQILVWNVDTLETVDRIKTIYGHDVHALEFIKNDEFLVVSFKRCDSPILVYRLEDHRIFLSCYIDSFADNILTVNVLKGKNRLDQEMNLSYNGWMIDSLFIFHSQYSFYIFGYNTQTKCYEKLIFNILENSNLSFVKKLNHPRITQLCAFYLNTDHPDLLIYGSESKFEMIIITGHSNGEVYLWSKLQNSYSFEKKLIANFKCSIEKLIHLHDKYLLIYTEDAMMYIWNMHSNKVVKEIELTLLPLRLQSLKIKDIIKGEPDYIYFSTIEGDMARLCLNYHKKWFNNFFVNEIKVERFDNIVYLKNNYNCITLLEQENEKIVFIGGDNSQVFAFSTTKHELVDKWSLSDALTCMDCVATDEGGTAFAFGTQKGTVMLRFDWEEYPKSFNCGKEITCIKFTPNASHIIAASANQFAYIFIHHNGSYFDFPPKEVPFENEIPLSINFTQNLSNVIIGTNTHNHYKLDLPDLKNKDLILENQELDISKMKLKYAINDKTNLKEAVPILFGQDVKFIISGDEYGNLMVFNNTSELVSNSGITLLGHASRIIDIEITQNKDYFYSLAKSDNALFEWALNFEIDSDNPKVDEGKKVVNYEHIDREILASTAFKRNLHELRDSFALFRGCSNTFLNNFFREKYKAFDENNYIEKRYPEYSLTLKHIYGFNCYDKTNSLYYVHKIKGNIIKENDPIIADIFSKAFGWSNDNFRFDTAKPAEKVKKNFRIPEDANKINTNKSDKNKKGNLLQTKSIFKSEDRRRTFIVDEYTDEEISNQLNKFTTIFRFDAKNDLKSSDGYCANKAQECDREIVYIVSKYAIIIDPLTLKEQRFYDNHKEKISCIAIHSCKRLIATGEAANNAHIHVWIPQNCTTYKILKTYHNTGIIDLIFSNQKYYLISTGLDKHVSLQFSNWLDGSILAFRFTDYEKILHIQAHPHEAEKFITGSYSKVDFWEYRNNTIIHNCSVDISESKFIPFITQIEFVYFYVENKLQYDLLISTNLGTVGIVRNEEFIAIEEINFKTSINCLRVINYNQNIFIIMAGESKTVKIYDPTFNLILEIDLAEHTQRKNAIFAIQSLDVYFCKDKAILAIGTRAGEIMEVGVSFNKLQSGQWYGSVKECDLLVKNHASANIDRCKNPMDFLNFKKILMSLHPKSNILVTCGDDCNLYFWDIIEKKPVLTKNLGIFPTVCKFSPDGNQLVIGFQNGIIMIFEPKITRSSNKIGNTFDVSLNVDPFVLKDKETKTAVLNISFSVKGDLMAVSYDNLKVNVEEEDVPKEKEGSFVIVYVSKNSPIKQYRAKVENESLYEKYTEIRLPSRYRTQQTKTHLYGMAIYYMAFSEDDNYLMLYFQRIDNFQIRENRDKEGVYVVWDLNSNTSVINWDILKNVKFKTNSFPNHIYGISALYSSESSMNLFRTGYDKYTLDELEKNKVTVSAIKDNQNHSFLGSMDGNIYIAKNSIFFLEPDVLPENIPKTRLHQAKTYPGHTSFVNQIELSFDAKYLFSTALEDECVLQWKLTKIEPRFELDHIDPKIDKDDIFLFEVEQKEKFYNFINEIYPPRNELIDLLQSCDSTVFPKIRLEMHKIFGRKALNRRNNIALTINKQLVYSAGSVIVLTNFEKSINEELKYIENGDNSKSSISESETSSVDETPKNQLFQTFILPDFANQMVGPAEISCLALSKTGNILCVGASKGKAELYFWDIASKSYISTLSLGLCVNPLYIKFSDDTNYLICYGIMNDYTGSLYYIDRRGPEILAISNFCHSLPFKIKDLDFLPFKNNEFITVGIQHISVWKYRAGTMEFNELKIEDPMKLHKGDFAQHKLNQAKEETMVCFLCITHLLSSVFVTGCDLGFIYLWQNKEIVQKLEGREKSPITVLSVSPTYSSEFISGSLDGIISYYLVREQYQTLTVSKIHEFDLNESGIVQSNAYRLQLQSLLFTEEGKIVYGTRNGEIGSIEFTKEKLDPDTFVRLGSNENDDLSEHLIIKPKSTHTVCSFFDNEVPKACDFAENESILLTITEYGLFTSYTIDSLEVVKQINFNEFTLDMIVLQKIVIIVFEKSILVLENNKKYELLKNFNMDFLTKINKTRANNDEDTLAIAFEGQNDYQPKIEIYRINENQFQKLYTINTDEVELLDFSSDNFYLLYKDLSGQRYCYDLSNYKKIETLGLDYNTEIDWMSDGLRLCERRSVI